MATLSKSERMARRAARMEVQQAKLRMQIAEDSRRRREQIQRGCARHQFVLAMTGPKPNRRDRRHG